MCPTLWPAWMLLSLQPVKPAHPQVSSFTVIWVPACTYLPPAYAQLSKWKKWEREAQALADERNGDVPVMQENVNRCAAQECGPGPGDCRRARLGPQRGGGTLAVPGVPADAACSTRQLRPPPCSMPDGVPLQQSCLAA